MLAFPKNAEKNASIIEKGLGANSYLNQNFIKWKKEIRQSLQLHWDSIFGENCNENFKDLFWFLPFSDL